MVDVSSLFLQTAGQLAVAVGRGDFDSELARLHYARDAEARAARYAKPLVEFARVFGGERPAALFSTPGRTEIGGNHTDHQHGCVLAGSVDLDIVAAAGTNADGTVRLRSEGFPETVVSLASLEPDPAEANRSSALVRGVAAQFAARGFPVSGLDICMTSSVLRGSGLSSSAAFEVMLGTIMNHFFARAALAPVDIATIGRYAENHFFGKPCGLMDQIACCVGGVQFIDFAAIDNPSIRKLPADFRAHGLALCIIDSGADHADLTDEYSPIPREMGAVAAVFGKRVLREVEEDEFFRRLPEVRRAAGDRATLRAMHFYADNRRAGEEADALARGDIPGFLGLVNASGRSSLAQLQNVFPLGSVRRQEVGVALGMCDRLLRGAGAYRIHGGGFAGTVQAFVPLAMIDGFREGMEAVFGAGSCHVLFIREAGSVRLA